MADFLTVNLSAVLKDQKSFDALEYKTSTNTDSGATNTSTRDLTKITDWAKELKDRLAENAALIANERKSEYEIEAKFFEDYFTYGETWGGNYTEELLSLGEPLKKAIKVLGFDKNVNPILGFISDDTVLRNLLQTKLLNVNTFKAIYAAVAENIIVDSEFFNSNDYNIIFCQDLYKRPAAEILEYLKLQKSILSPTAPTYTKADQNKNKKIFLKITDNSTIDAIKKRYPEESLEGLEKLKDALENMPANSELPAADKTGTTLNSLKLANFLAGKTGTTDNSKKSGDAEYTESNSGTVTALANKLGKNSAQAFVALQYLSATTNLPEAAKELKNEAFKNISIEALTGVSAGVMKVMKEAKLSEDEAKSFVVSLLRSLDRNN